MDSFIIPIFPPGSLMSSVVTTVWLGVCVTAFFNLRYGWVLSGLVIPGYLVPLLIVKPWSAAAILAEGVATYLLVWGLSEKVAPRFGCTNLFGRDRFFALLLASVVVRLTFDGWLLPVTGEWVTHRFDITFDYRNNLHSYGLIIVALIANQLWKPGFVRGLLPLASTVGATFILVRYGLMEFTNFSLSNLSYMYEDIASSILASPKAYIILLVTAFVASRMNLLYGWEFNGILIPSLLALQWYQPGKILATFVETLLILGAAHLLMRTPLFRKMTIEGARKVLLFFNLSFGYKLLLGYGFLVFLPNLKVSDYYGFGYLLPSLLAIKMYDKEIAAQVTRATLQTSLVAVLVATGVGYALSFLPALEGPGAGVERTVAETSVSPSTLSMRELIQQHQIQLYQSRRQGFYAKPLPWEIRQFRAALKRLRLYRDKPDLSALADLRSSLAPVRYEAILASSGALVLRELEPRKGWGLYMVNPGSESGLLVEIPAPAEEWGVAVSGAGLFETLDAGALSIAGANRRGNPDGSADVLNNHENFMNVFQQEIGLRNTLQVRGQTQGFLRALTGKTASPRRLDDPDLESTLFIKRKLPASLDLKRLQDLVPEFNTAWHNAPLANRLRDNMREGFAELRLTRPDRRTLHYLPAFANRRAADQARAQSIAGYLQDWILSGKDRIAGRASNAYVRPKLEELLYFDEAILTPLTRLIRTNYRGGQWDEEGLQELRALAPAIDILGYELIRYHNLISGRDYLILAEIENAASRRYWGTYIFRLGPSEPYLVEVPRPLFEINVFEFGVALFERTQAQALLIAGTHPKANLDGSSDLIHSANKQNIFSLTHQVLLRESGSAPAMVVLCRAFGFQPGLTPPTADVLLASVSGVDVARSENLLRNNLEEAIAQIGLNLRRVDGSADVRGYEAGNPQQAQYLNQTINKDFIVLWVSPLARAAFRQQSENTAESAQFESVGIPTVEDDLFTYLQNVSGTESAQPTRKNSPEALKESIRRHIETGDIVFLQKAITESALSHRLVRIIDTNTKQAFVVVLSESTGLPVLAANTAPVRADQMRTVSRQTLSRDQIVAFVESRDLWIEWTDNDEVQP